MIDVPFSSECAVGADPALSDGVDTTGFEEQLFSELRRYFEQLAARLGGVADLRVVDDDRTTTSQRGAVGNAHQALGTWLLRPVRPMAADIRWHASESDAYSVYLTLGQFTTVEVFTSPRWSLETAVGSVAGIVEAVTAGRFKEEAWYSKASGQLVNTLGKIQYHQHDRWRSIGEVSRPLPLLRNVLCSHRVREYSAYRP